ncbi:MAG: lysophospholipid acyltransferase family protein [Candidatus Eisenbacteria bacterium]
MKPSPSSARATLRHRLEYVALRALAFVAGALPRPAAFALGRGLGALARMAGIRVAVARANLGRAFPERSTAERATILRRSYSQAGMATIELLRARRPDELARASLSRHVAGLEHIAAARQGGRGVILVSGHFGAFEHGGTAVAGAGHGVHYFARPQSNPLVDRFVAACRAGLAGTVIHHGRRGVKEALDLLRDGGVIAMAADQDGGRDGVFVTFLGQPSSTPPGPAEFALRTGAPLVCGAIWRSPDGAHYAGEFLPPIEPVRSGDHAADVRALTQAHARALEDFVRAHPEQWLWTHRRWKTTPPDPGAARARVLAAAVALAVALVGGRALAAAAPPVAPEAVRRPAVPDSVRGPAESVFDGAGSSVFPLERARVRRVFEDIRILRLPDGWSIDAEEWFEAGVAPARALMGLPDYKASLPAAERAQPGRAAMKGTLRGLVVTVDGLPMALEEIAGASGPGEDLGGIERIFRFAVPFSAEESRSVRLRYRFGESRTDGGEPLLFFYRNPGSLWEGESPKSTVSIDLGDVSPEDLVVGWVRPLGYRLYGSQILWHRPAGEELADIALGIRAPGDPLAAFADRQRGPLALPLEGREEWIARLTARDLRFFAAWLVARRGGPVADPVVAAILTREPWYKPARSFRENRLPTEERSLLARLRERLVAWERARIPYRAGPPFVPEPAPGGGAARDSTGSSTSGIPARGG